MAALDMRKEYKPPRYGFQKAVKVGKKKEIRRRGGR